MRGEGGEVAGAEHCGWDERGGMKEGKQQRRCRDRGMGGRYRQK